MHVQDCRTVNQQISQALKSESYQFVSCGDVFPPSFVHSIQPKSDYSEAPMETLTCFKMMAS